MEFGAERVPVRAFGQNAPWIAFLALACFLCGLIADDDHAALAGAEQGSAIYLSVFDVPVRVTTRSGAVHRVRASSTPRLLPDGRVVGTG